VTKALDDREVIRRRLQATLQTLPTHRERMQALDWIEAAVTSRDGITRELVEAVLNGKLAIVQIVDGAPSFRMTEAGMNDAVHLLADSPELRAMVERLSGRAVIAPPKDVQ
jgi:hypothetical protein